jgi:nicotinamide-nucleotide amidase
VNSAQKLFDHLSVYGLKLVTAESCTGGMVAAAITDIAGSSAVVDRGFITYSNAAKIEMLSVPAELINDYGAVSEQVAMAMAQGALKHSSADIAVAITGVAGPSGGSVEKPVGQVHFAVATGEDVFPYVQQFGNLSRAEIRIKAMVFALESVSKCVLERE